MSLLDSISQEIRRINRSGFIKVVSDVQGTEKNIPDQHKMIAFRIVQEGLQNIIKHAGASDVQVSIRYLEDGLYITLADNGVGFDPETELKKKDGLGLQNILRGRNWLVAGRKLSVSRVKEPNYKFKWLMPDVKKIALVDDHTMFRKGLAVLIGFIPRIQGIDGCGQWKGIHRSAGSRTICRTSYYWIFICP